MSHVKDLVGLIFLPSEQVRNQALTLLANSSSLDLVHQYFSENISDLVKLADLLKSSKTICNDIFVILLNTTASENVVDSLPLTFGTFVVDLLQNYVEDLKTKNYLFSLLCNVTRNSDLLETLLSSTFYRRKLFESIKKCIGEDSTRSIACRVLCNVTCRDKESRSEILNDKSFLLGLKPLICIDSFEPYALGFLKNSCAESAFHSSIFSEPMNLGPGLKELVLNGISIDRESRLELLEFILVLLSSPQGRMSFRDINMYEAIKYLYETDKDEECMDLCYRIVDFLIRDEETKLDR